MDPLLKNPPLEKVEPKPMLLEAPRLLEAPNEVPNQLSELLEQLTHISSPFANEKIVVPVQKSTFKKSRSKSKKMR